MSGRPEECVSSPERTAAVLAVSPLPAERDRLQKILSQENWQLYEASDCCEALALLRDQSVPVLLCERDHADGNWEDLLNTTASLPAPPNLIVFSRLARRIPLGEGAPVGMRLWCEHRQKNEGCEPRSCIRWENVVAPPGRTAGTLTWVVEWSSI